MDGGALLKVNVSAATRKLQLMHPVLVAATNSAAAAAQRSRAGSVARGPNGVADVVGEGGCGGDQRPTTECVDGPAGAVGSLLQPTPEYSFGLELNITTRVLPALRGRAVEAAAAVRLAYDVYCSQKQLHNEQESEFALIVEERNRAMAATRAKKLAELLQALALGEADHRHAVLQAYYKFVTWVNDSVPVWIEDVRRREHQRVAAEHAAAAQAEANRQAQISLDLQRQQAMRELGERQAREGEERLRQLRELQEEEHRVKERLAAKRRAEEARTALEAERREAERRDALVHLDAEQALLEAKLQRERDERYAALLQEEEEVAARLEQRERERKMLVEHLRAEEELLQRKLERQRKAQEEARRAERERALDQIAREEAELQARLAERERARQLQREEELHRLRDEEQRTKDTLEAREYASRVQRDSWLAAQAEMLRAEQEHIERRMASNAASHVQRQMFVGGGRGGETYPGAAGGGGGGGGAEGGRVNAPGWCQPLSAAQQGHGSGGGASPFIPTNAAAPASHQRPPAAFVDPVIHPQHAGHQSSQPRPGIIPQSMQPPQQPPQQHWHRQSFTM